jgi:hypothetical protein
MIANSPDMLGATKDNDLRQLIPDTLSSLRASREAGHTRRISSSDNVLGQRMRRREVMMDVQARHLP